MKTPKNKDGFTYCGYSNLLGELLYARRKKLRISRRDTVLGCFARKLTESDLNNLERGSRDKEGDLPELTLTDFQNLCFLLKLQPWVLKQTQNPCLGLVWYSREFTSYGDIPQKDTPL